MPPQRDEFGEMLSWAIRHIAHHQNKLIKTIEKDISDACGRDIKSVQAYRQGTIPPDDDVLLKIGMYVVQEAAVSRPWIEEFLKVAGRDEWQTLSQCLFAETAALHPASVASGSGALSVPVESNQEAWEGMTATSGGASQTQPAEYSLSVEKPSVSRPVRMGIAAFVIILLIISGNWGWRTAERLSAQNDLLLLDGGFEKLTDLSHWRNVGGCDLAVEEGDAVEGQRYLEVRGLAPCYSFSQDTRATSVLGRTYTFSAWFRSPETAYPEGELVIWGGRPIRDEFNDLEKGATNFQIKGGEWQCISTQITVNNADTSILRAEIYLRGFDGQMYQVDDVRFTEGAEAPCPTAPTQIYNGSFEEHADGILPWLVDASCQVDIRRDKDHAHDGQAFMTIDRGDNACNSFRQFINLDAKPNDTYNFSLWVRSSDGISRTVETVIWGGGLAREKSPRYYTFEGTDWQCVESTLRTQQAGKIELTLELYLHDQAGAEVWIDNARFQLGVSETCPRPALRLTNLLLPFGTDARYYAGAVIPVVAEVANHGTLDSTPTSILYWVTTQINADPLEPNIAPEDDSIPVVAPESSYVKREDNVFVPVGLSPGQYYIVAELGETGDRYTLNEPITIEACEGEGYFCDISDDSWAYHGIQQWAEIPITNGCRSGTEPYNNRPFCPKMIVDNWAVALFILRHLKGPEFKPNEPLEPYYTDILLEDPSQLAFEYFHQNGVELIPTGCLKTLGEPKACPFQMVTRGDLARYLAIVLDWNLESQSFSGPEPFIDLPEDEFTRQAILYMESQGFLDFREPDCLPVNGARRFCPASPLRRANAAAIMTSVFSK